MKVGITHHKFDLDAGSCMRFLQKTGEIERIVFGIEKVKDVAKDATKIIFADASLPSSELPDIETEVYDQHFLEKVLKERMVKEKIEISSFGLLTKAKGIKNLRIQQWEEVVNLADFKKDSGDMDIKRALNRINDFMGLSDEEVYEQWFIPLMDSFLEKEKDVERGQKILRESILGFILNNRKSPAIPILQRWLKNIEEKLDTLDAKRNIFHFLCYMDEEVGNKWLSLVIEALHKEQVDFQDAKSLNREFMRSAKVDLSGLGAIISQVTSSQSFSRVIRYMIRSQDETLPSQIKEKTADPTKPWILIQVNPENMNFQILSGGGRSGVSKEEYGEQMAKLTRALKNTYIELVKALRAEVLKRRQESLDSWRRQIILEREEDTQRMKKLIEVLKNASPKLKLVKVLEDEVSKREDKNKSIPSDREILSEPGYVLGTGSLFFNQKDFPQILWGSRTHDAPPAKVFGENPEQIRKRLVEITKSAIDNRFFPASCDPKNCSICPLQPWWLQKCHNRRKYAQSETMKATL